MQMHDPARALVYKDHLGRGWYAYCPHPSDSLDAEGSIPARNFTTRAAAEKAVRSAIAVAARRPKDTAVGMGDFEQAVQVTGG